MIDDDVIHELPEGQDMVVEFSELRNNSRRPDLNSDSSDWLTFSSVMKLIF